MMRLRFTPESSHILANGSDESQLIKCWRTQVIDQAPDISDDEFDLSLKLVQQCIGGRGITLVERADQSHLEHDRAEHRPQPIMQIAPQATALFFPRRDQVFPRALQILCEDLQ